MLIIALLIYFAIAIGAGGYAYKDAVEDDDEDEDACLMEITKASILWPWTLLLMATAPLIRSVGFMLGRKEDK